MIDLILTGGSLGLGFIGFAIVVRFAAWLCE